MGSRLPMRHVLAFTILAICAVVVVPAQASAGVFSPISPAPFGLQQTGLGATEYGRVAKLEAKYPPVGVGDVIAGANRTVRPLGNSPALAGVPSVAGGFRWQSGDDTVDYWIRRASPGARTPSRAAWSTATASCSSAGTPRTARACGCRSSMRTSSSPPPTGTSCS